MVKHSITCHQHHVGSFLRTPALIKAQALRDDKTLTDEALTAVEDEAIQHAVRLQSDLGFQVFNDGEYLRDNFWETFFESLGGFVHDDTQPLDRLLPFLPWGYLACQIGAEPGLGPGQSLHLTGKIEFQRSIGVAELKRLQRLVPVEKHASIKQTLCSPGWHYIRYAPGMAFADAPYATKEEYFADLSAAYRAEIMALYDAGLRAVQLDSAEFSFFCDEQIRAGWQSVGWDPIELLKDLVGLVNDCLKDLPDDLVVNMHICRGNFRSIHFATGAYDSIAPIVFPGLPRVNTFLLEFDTASCGGFEPLAHVPADTNVVLGLISTKSSLPVESFPKLKARVLEAADVLAASAGQSRRDALRRVGVSPQCGFESAQGGNNIDEFGMVIKLMLVRDLAQDVFGQETTLLTTD